MIRMATVEQRIAERLGELEPVHLEVINESHGHNVPAGSETHFRVVVVSRAFEGLRPVARHRRVYELLAGELAGPVHALALQTHTPEEWAHGGRVAESPPCLGGGKREAS
ncbi:MAG: BolA family transcriptional regulator [Gammaproteobacteria bacterium]|nr:MAG: BolA family transcriptional regulator [Gammaproteobacteria bacterium]